MDNEKSKIKTNIGSCARCGYDHADLEFKKFEQNPIEDSDGTVWNYWALCPVTGEPILLKVIENG